ncbi:hypothetical protein AAL_01760 [Moelleriella libera RCEF 2490]|uniref:Uncharacterized protein n=1 Tax=Moelleriella libera RCEF 2490 TaxID=1081109 RepID=A0A166UF56_9HYPO|nr:hypothetical protein AAL_01760 [Moelleriella libera RCEF 2490]
MRSLPSSRRVLSHTTTQWPLLKRRQPPTSPASPQPPPASPPPPPPPPSSSSPSPSSSGDGDGSASASSTPSRKDARVMLILRGLSPSLNASDFHRLAPSSLSSWQHAIKKVQQLRDPLTLAPLGRYHISFAHAVAAIAYRDNLLRLHKLARHRHAHSGDVLWESTVPAHLRSWTGTTTQQEQQSPAAELDGFTVTMGLGDAVDVQRRRVPATRNGWARRLRDLVVARVRGRPPHGENAAEAEAEADAAPLPPVVLVVAYPPTLRAGHLRRAIREDGLRHGLPWKVFPPEPLLQPQPQPQQQQQQSDSAAAPSTESFSDDSHDDTSGDRASEDSATSGTSRVPEKLKGRFVVVCADESEARRFHRHWNRKTLTAGLEGGALRRNVLDASIINW